MFFNKLFYQTKNKILVKLREREGGSHLMTFNLQLKGTDIQSTLALNSQVKGILDKITSLGGGFNL